MKFVGRTKVWNEKEKVSCNHIGRMTCCTGNKANNLVIAGRLTGSAIMRYRGAARGSGYFKGA